MAAMQVAVNPWKYLQSLFLDAFKVPAIRADVG